MLVYVVDHVFYGSMKNTFSIPRSPERQSNRKAFNAKVDLGTPAVLDATSVELAQLVEYFHQMIVRKA